MKRLLCLGAGPFQTPAIVRAREAGHWVMVCDYLPHNPGHALAHASSLISTTDRAAVLDLARRERIDGILGYASDPAAPTAAFVAEQLGLPGNPLAAVEILTDKARLRDFQRAHDFRAPRHGRVTSLDDAQDLALALGLSDGPPLMVKPVDASGSKGVRKVRNPEQLAMAFHEAMQHARSKAVIIEACVQRAGHQIAGDGFVVGGRLVFHALAQEHFNAALDRPVPVGESFPLLLPQSSTDAITHEVQRLITALGLRDGELNFDIMLDAQGRVHLMEMAPRAGGNGIPEVIRHATGVDLCAAAVDAALGLDLEWLEHVGVHGFWASAVFHAEQAGILQTMALDGPFEIVSQQAFAKPGNAVHAFTSAQQALGLAVLRFETAQDMIATLDHLREHLRVRLNVHPHTF